jgi:DUF1680 family protein
MAMKQFIWFLSITIYLGAHAQEKSAIQLFPLQDVRLLPGAFKDAEQTDKNYIMAMDPDRLLSPYLREAGIEPKAKSYPNWENTGLDGHIGGHYLSALSLMYASTGDKQILERLNYMLKELKACQDKTGTGYIGGVPGSSELWNEIKQGKINAGSFDLNKKWVPLYNIHKTYAGLKDAYLYAGLPQAKEMLIRYTDWMVDITSSLSDEQIQTMLKSEHGGLNEIFADVYQITGNKKYLDLAYRFSHQFILNPLSKREDKLNNMHANTQIPKVIGYERIAELTGDTAYKTAASFFWQTVTENRSVVIGGNSVREHFHPVDNFSGMINSEQGPETCNTYNMLRLTKMLFSSQADEKYIDFYERGLYNHILSSQHPGNGGFVYFTPMRPGHYRVYSQPSTSMWCCVGSGLENHAKYGELIYAFKQNDLFINLFIPSSLNWKDKGVVINQKTSFPEEGRTVIKIDKAKNSAFSIQVRHPQWIASTDFKIKVNGKFVKTSSKPGSYAIINRKWNKGDSLEISLPMKISTEPLPDGSGYNAFLYGPIVLAAKTDTTDLKGLFADDSRMGHVAQGKQIPLQNMPFLVSNPADVVSKIKGVEGKELKFSFDNIVYPEKYKSLELIPFYKLHDSRYIVYWPVITQEKLKEVQKRIADEEAIRQALAAKTIDVVFCGEQQPESDHFIESENSVTGVTEDRHWRLARGWFSYKFIKQIGQANKIGITFWGEGRKSKSEVYINNTLIGTITISETDKKGWSYADFIIPESVKSEQKDAYIVKIATPNGSDPVRITEVRVLRN